MKYYKLLGEIDPKRIGIKEGRQISRMTEPYNYNTYNSVRQIQDHLLELDFEPDLDTQVLKKQAKLTDMINSEIINSIVAKIFSQRFIEFLMQFNLPKHKTYLTPLVKIRGAEQKWFHSHYMFMLTETANEQIDFKKSVFVLKPIVYNPSVELIPVIIRDYNELRVNLEPKSYVKGGKRLYGNKVKFNPEMNFDLIRLQFLGGYYVSSRLKKAIEREGFTGMRFEEAKNIVVDKA